MESHLCKKAFKSRIEVSGSFELQKSVRGKILSCGKVRSMVAVESIAG